VVVLCPLLGLYVIYKDIAEGCENRALKRMFGPKRDQETKKMGNIIQ
jgi:hypothetical protein